MAVSFTKSSLGGEVLGRRRLHPGRLTLDNSYPTGGYALTVTTIKGVNAKRILGALQEGGNAAAGPYRAHWDSGNNKLMIFSGATEVANATNLSTVTLNLIFVLA